MHRREFLVAGSAAALALSLEPALARTPAKQGDAGLNALLDGVFDDQMRHSPEYATALGLDKGALAAQRGKLSPRTAAERRAALQRAQGWLARLKRLDKTRLSQAGKRNLALAQYQIEQGTTAAAQFDLDGVQRPYRLFQQGGAYFSLPDFLNSQHPVAEAGDAEAYLSRLAGFAVALDQDTAEQRAQAARGYLAPGWSLDLTLGQMEKLRAPKAEDSGLVASLVRRAKAKGLVGDWQARATAIVEKEVYPALDRQMALLRQLRPTTAAGDGAWRMPRGDEIYAAALKQATTTTLSPEEVHRIGLEQVAEISAELDGILKAAGLTQGSVGARLTALNQQADQLYPNTAEGRKELIEGLNAGVADMYKRLPPAFSTIPQQPLEIRAVPVDIQDGASNGYYNRASLDGTRPAIYWINLKDVGDWPKYTLPALTYHEGVPGHHLQGSLAQLSGELPMLLRNVFISAYGEGWALYAEQLADELGAFKGIERAGYLQSFLFRASRLVIDTGLHHKRWSREKATDYMIETTGFARPRSQREVERYCTQMGQACSYKIGHTAWAKARARAQAALGDKFSLPWFHDVLNEGVMPLSMLEARIDERVKERLAKG